MWTEEKRQIGERVPKFRIKHALWCLFGVFAVVAVFGAIYTVEEGHVGIVKHFKEAKAQVNPGLHFKIPFVQTVEEMEVRTRKNVEKMPSSTSEQMPTTVFVSVNWTVDKSAALDLYIKYGGLDQFENRILDPRFRSATKAVIPKFSAEQLIQDRSTAIERIEALLLEEMASFPVAVDNVQIENIELPAKYIDSIQIKQTEKNLADAEKHKLARQNLEAQRKVNVANAEAESIEKISVAEANATEVKGSAEAKSIRERGAALRDNPLIVELEKAKRWNGQLPHTIMGSGAVPILDMRQMGTQK